jgi:hypothetical protein
MGVVNPSATIPLTSLLNLRQQQLLARDTSLFTALNISSPVLDLRVRIRARSGDAGEVLSALQAA